MLGDILRIILAISWLAPCFSQFERESLSLQSVTNAGTSQCAINVYFTIDTSESVALKSPMGSLMNELKIFVRELVTDLQVVKIKGSQVKWKYGALHFSDQVEDIIGLTDQASTFTEAVNRVKYIGRGTFVDCALKAMTEAIQRDSGAGGGLKFAIILTDGHVSGNPCGGTTEAVEAMRAVGIKTFVVATSLDTIENELVTIASSPAEIYRNNYLATPSNHRKRTITQIIDIMMKEAESECGGSICLARNGAPGLKGLKGFKGAKGSIGLPGDPGPPGPQGDLGIEGPIGFPGQKGYTGQKGEQGDIGEPGMKGDHGTPGYNGIAGEKGKPGHVGSTGCKGRVGIQGEEGPRGTVGLKGMPGDPGEKNCKERGSIVVKNASGHPRKSSKSQYRSKRQDRLLKLIHLQDLGTTSAELAQEWQQEGNSPDLNPIENLWSVLKRRLDKQKPTNSDKLQALIMQEWAAISQDVAQKLIDSMPGRIAEGYAGKQGQSGSPGPKGELGDKGPSGYRGNVGIPGLKGLKGKTGPSGVTGDQGIRGDNGLPGPRGLTGNKGPQGDMGPEGNRGLPGERGSKGGPGAPGFPGPRGPPGVSGSIGKQGSPGDPGDIGVRGDIGLPGSPGDRGKQGNSYTGPRGVQGDRGEPGLPGFPGSRGYFGTKGEQGPKGAKGDPGEYGQDGQPGERGPTGSPGYPGPPGDRGDPGITNCEIKSYVEEICGCCDCYRSCQPVDVVFVIDSSESVGKTNFSLAKHFVINIANRIGKMAKNASDLTGSRLGVVQYSHQGAVELIRMDDSSINSKASFLSKVKSMEWLAGGTWTPSALKYAYEELIRPNQRAVSKVVAIVITDGRYDPKDIDKLESLCRGVEVHAIGIGDMFNSSAENRELEKIACNVKDRVRNLSVYAELAAEEFLENIEAVLCPEPEIICPDQICTQAVTLAPLVGRPVDIVFFVDGSERTGRENFVQVLQFIQHVSQELKLATHDKDLNGARISILQYGGENEQNMLLDFTYNHTSFQTLPSRAIYYDSSSHIGNAILYAVKNIVQGRAGGHKGARQNAEVSFVFITDGMNNNKNFASGLDSIRANNIITCAIAVGSHVNSEKLAQLTLRDRNSLFMLKQYDQLFATPFVRNFIQWLG
ncbi:collagen alpha-2(VI) chain-like [Rhinophrynus dorsalis]